MRCLETKSLFNTHFENLKIIERVENRKNKPPIAEKCWQCHGTGIYLYNKEVCSICNGKGIIMSNEGWL